MRTNSKEEMNAGSAHSGKAPPAKQKGKILFVNGRRRSSSLLLLSEKLTRKA